MFLLGLTFPGKNIIWYNYVLEISKDEWRSSIVNTVFAIELSAIIWIAFYYQMISRSWLYLQIFAFVLTAVVFAGTVVLFCESPKYLYSKYKFDEARDSLKWIAKLNGIKYDDVFIFDTEY
mgnify:CR=1 FL=1